MRCGGLLAALGLALALATAEPGRGRAFFPIDVGIDEHSVYIPDVLIHLEPEGPGGKPPPGT